MSASANSAGAAPHRLHQHAWQAGPCRGAYHAAGAEGGPLLDVIEGALSKLLEQSLEDTTFQALKSNLEPAPAGDSSTPSQAAITFGGFGGPAPGGAANGGATAAAVAAALAEATTLGGAAERCSLLSILILIYYHPRKQCTPDRFLSLAKLFHATLFARGARRAPAAGSMAAALEGEPSPAQMSVKLVSAPGRAAPVCSPLLRSRGAPALLQRTVAPCMQSQHCAVWLPALLGETAPGCPPPPPPVPPLPHPATPPPQATLLLLEMLDVDKALAALAAGQPLDEASYVFAGARVKQQVNAELASWWPSAAAAHSPVLLAWAAVLCLIGKSAGARRPGGCSCWACFGAAWPPRRSPCCYQASTPVLLLCRRAPSAPLAAGQGPTSEDEDIQQAEAHASKAHETDALGTLCALTTHAGMQPNAAEMMNNIVLR